MSYPATYNAAVENEGEMPLDDLMMEDGEIGDDAGHTRTAPQQQEQQQHQQQHPRKRRAQKRTAAAPPSQDEDDFWDDSALIVAWDRAMDRHKRRERGEVLSDSSDDDNGDDNDDNGYGTQNGDNDAVATQDPSSIAEPAAPTIPMGGMDPDSAQLTDAELVQRMSSHWYWAGYYAGLYSARTAAAAASQPQ
ncbi:hypothetical protein BC828DRAFT_221962 [Blastocladiella britannica]|nr:hypothetical protein BC828DRAFT_221962 [Blastocladiella britannica]